MRQSATGPGHGAQGAASPSSATGAGFATGPFLALVLGSVAIGASPIFVRLSELGPFATAFWRVSLALPLLALWALYESRTKATSGMALRARDAWPFLLAGVLFAGDLMFWHLSILHTSVANATLLANFSPVVVTLGAYFLLKEHVSARFLAGLALAMAGVVLLLGDSFQFEPDNLRGDIYGLITALFFGSYVLSVRSVRARYGAGEVMFWSGLVTALALLAVTVLAGERVLPATAPGWAVLTGLALLSHAAGQGLLAYSLGHLPAGLSSLVILIEPVAAALLGFLILNETLGPLQGLGGAIILTGIVWAQRAEGRASRPAVVSAGQSLNPHPDGSPPKDSRERP